MITHKQFAKTVKKITSYKPKKAYRMPNNPPPKKELERRFRIKKGNIIEITD